MEEEDVLAISSWNEEVCCFNECAHMLPDQADYKSLSTSS